MNSWGASKGFYVVFTGKPWRNSREIPGEILGDFWMNFRGSPRGIDEKIFGDFWRNFQETFEGISGDLMEACLKSCQTNSRRSSRGLPGELKKAPGKVSVETVGKFSELF